VKQKRMAKTKPVPGVIRDDGLPEDDSLAENDERIGLHPLDRFRAFQALRDGGMREEDIAARHFVTPAIVKQRLRLASVCSHVRDELVHSLETKKVRQRSEKMRDAYLLSRKPSGISRASARRPTRKW